MMDFNQFLSIFLLFLVSEVPSAKSSSSEKFHEIRLLHNNGRLRESTSLGYSDIYFNLPKYFGDYLGSSNGGEHLTKYGVLFKELVENFKRIQKYAKEMLKDGEVNVKLFQLLAFFNTAGTQTNFNKKNESIFPDTSLKTMIKVLHKEIITETTKKGDDVYKGLFIRMAWLIRDHRKQENCVTHASGREILTSLAFVKLLTVYRLGRKKQKTLQAWSPEFQSFVKDFDFSLKVLSRIGTRDTFACTPEGGYRARANLGSGSVLKNDTQLYEGIIQAAEGNVITGVRFRIFKGKFLIQIKEKKLLPFGFTSNHSAETTPQGWTQPPPLNTKKLKPIKVGCSFLLDRHHLAPDQVLVGVQFKLYEDEDGSCFIGVVTYGRKIDLLTGEFFAYKRKYFNTRSNYQTFHREKTIKTLVDEQYLTGKGRRAASVLIEHSPAKIHLEPRIDTQNVESVSSMAQNGLEVYLSRGNDRAGFLHLTLVSLDVPKQLGAQLQLEKYPGYYKLESGAKFFDENLYKQK